MTFELPDEPSILESPSKFSLLKHELAEACHPIFEKYNLSLTDALSAVVLMINEKYRLSLGD